MKTISNFNTSIISEINSLLKDTNITVCSEKGVDAEINQILREKFVKQYGTFYVYPVSEEKANAILAKLTGLYSNNSFDARNVQFMLDVQTSLGFEILDMSLSSMPEKIKQYPNYIRTVDNSLFDVWTLSDDSNYRTYAKGQNFDGVVNYVNKQLELVLENETSKEARNMTKILNIENALDNDSLALIHKLDTFSKIPRLQELNKNQKLPLDVACVFNLGNYLKTNEYISDVCQVAIYKLREIANKLQSGDITQDGCDLLPEEYCLFKKIAIEFNSLYEISYAASEIRKNDEECKWYKVSDGIDLQEV